MKKAIVGVYRHDPRAKGGEGQSRLVKTIDLEEQLAGLIRRRGWKSDVMKKVQEVVGENVDVLAVSLVHGDADLNVNIAVTVQNKPPRFGQKKKAATIGNRPAGGGPVQTGKTMAAKRRSSQR